MQYEYLSQEEQDDIVAEAMRQRETEHFHYTHNAAVYEEMLKTLPDDDWPADVQQHRGKQRDQIIDDAGPRAEVALQYTVRDRLRHLRATELAEAANIDRIHTGLVARFGGNEARRTAAVDRIKNRARNA